MSLSLKTLSKASFEFSQKSDLIPTRIVFLSHFLSFVCLSQAAAFGAEIEKHDFIDDWNATGSGCRASKSDSKTSQLLEVTQPNQAMPNSFLIKFRPQSMKLETPEPTGTKLSGQHIPIGVPKEKALTLAKECSLRVALFPPAGKRIKNVTAVSLANVTKSAPFPGWLSSELALGNQTLAELRIDYKEGENVRSRSEEIKLIPGRKEGQAVPQSRCGQPRILAHDTIFAAERKNVTDETLIELGNKGTIEIALDLENCK